MTILTVFINNRHGSLIFHRDFEPSRSRLSANEAIVAASTFHGMSHVVASLTPPALLRAAQSKAQSHPDPSSTPTSNSHTHPNPNPNSNAQSRVKATAGTGGSDSIIPFLQPSAGIESVCSAASKATRYQSLSGLEFVVVSDRDSASHENLILFLRDVYKAFATLVVKNPFVDPDMPIRLPAFEDAVTELRAKVRISA